MTDVASPARLFQIERERLLLMLRASARHADLRRLTAHGAKYFSQGDEDGIIAEIFRRIGERSRRFVEIGVGDGLENNTLHLLAQSWTGAWFEADAAATSFIRRKFAPAIQSGTLALVEAMLDRDNVQAFVAMSGVTGEIDLLSVDVDGNDHHLLAALANVRPRVVVVEYNARFGPHVDWVMPYDPGHRWDGSDRFGASLAALTKLMNGRNMELVGCNLVGSNAFYVSRSEDLRAFLAPFTATEQYEPARYHLLPWSAGHPSNALPELASTACQDSPSKVIRSEIP